MNIEIGKRLLCCVGAVVITSTFAVPLQAGEGFGMLKKTANLTRIHPPELFVTGTRIAVHVTSQSNAHASAAQRLQSQLESELINNNPRFKLDGSNPDTTVDVRILQSDYRDDWQDRLMTHSVPNGKDAKGRQQYRQEQVNVRFKIVKYTFASAFKVHDTRADAPVGADTINSNFQQEFQNGDGAPDAQALENNAVNMVVGQLTRRLAPTKEVIGVLLPKGSFDAISNFADAGLWSKYLEALERMSPLPKPLDEAYRQYALGVANEAVAYSAEETEQTLKYLEEASTHYNNAVDANPKEGYFTKSYQGILRSSQTAEAPLTRVQAALVQYQKIKQFDEKTAPARRASPAAVGAKGLDSSAPDDAMTNASIIDMLHAGLPEDVILTSIESAPHTALDASPRGLIELSNAKASKKLIQRVQALASGASKPAATKKASKSATAKKP
ncbi:MAG TPA: hypothetical protein VN605_10540 [Thermoanaerobaculia bacterium]|nr:hypothetical protein [Thermoanaerobaculia bacterium]